MKPCKNIYKLLNQFIKMVSILNIVFLIHPLAYGAVITVGPSGNYQKIQDAINASLDGDEVIVSQGKYVENIKFNGKNIILRSTDPTDTNIVSMTIIDGNTTDSVATFSGTELTTCVLSGFTIKNGKAIYGGGIHGGNYSQRTLASIQNNTITGNHASYNGGGLYSCDGIIQNNTITGNSAAYGGGLLYCNGTIQNNTITGNYADYYDGGGLFDCNGTIQNNTITGNFADNGGGGLAYSYGIIQNNIIANNFAIYYGGGLCYCNGIIQNNTIIRNCAENYYPYPDSDSAGGGLSYCDGTIQNNIITENYADYGGGLYDCNTTIQNNTIAENAAYYGGGLDYCNGIIQYNTIAENYADDHCGGGLCDCNGIIQNNTITENTAVWKGGGLFGCNGTIQNNTITGNSADNGGGGLAYCDGTIQNNTITENHSKCEGSGLHYCCGFIINCIIWNNSATSDPQIYDSAKPFYSCIQNWDGSGRGNISDNPRFVDPTNKDFHLQPDSPCLDKGNTYYLIGDVYKDMDGECRITGSSVDMGADEYGRSIDSDGDLLSDDEETTMGCNINNPDTDGDGLIDGAEVLRGTNPLVKDSPSGILIPSNYPTIQQGIFMALPGENVTISFGTYNENLYFGGKNIVLQSTNPLDVNTRNNTIIDGNKLSSVISLKGMEDENCIIQGLTIRNGYSSLAYEDGGAIYGRSSNAIIQNNVIIGNFAHYAGGGLSYCYGTIQNNAITGNSGCGLRYCNGKIQNNIITENSTGGLINCDGIIQNNTITGNSSNQGQGGGLAGCDGTIQNNAIIGNFAYDGGGLGCCNGIIQNNIITGNSAAFGGGLYSCNGKIQNNVIIGNSSSRYGSGFCDCNGIIRNCIIWGNSKEQLYSSAIPSYSCIQGWSGGGTGNINLDPQFVDPATNNYHLKSTSPCIDAGCLIVGLTKDFEGNARPFNGTTKPRGDGSDYDIGAYEYNICTLDNHEISNYLLGKTSPPQEIVQQMDVNNDGKIDIADVVYFILHKK